MEGLRSDYDPRMESVEDYRDRMRRYVAICALRELPVDEQAIAEQVVRADVLSAIHGLEGQQAVQYLKESACALLMEARLDPEGQTTLKVLINQLERYGVTLSSSQDKLFSGHTTNSSPEKRGAPASPPGTPVRKRADDGRPSPHLLAGVEAPAMPRVVPTAEDKRKTERAARIMQLVHGATTLEEAKKALADQLHAHLE